MLAWVNDEQNLRAYGSKTDAYAMFSVMLDVGSPPDSFHVLTKKGHRDIGALRNRPQGGTSPLSRWYVRPGSARWIWSGCFCYHGHDAIS